MTLNAVHYTVLCYYHRKRHFFLLILDFTITSTVRLQNFRAHRCADTPVGNPWPSTIGYYPINYDVFNGMKPEFTQQTEQGLYSYQLLLYHSLATACFDTKVGPSSCFYI